ncbi:EcoAI/FtnUII family type I restriction enzme subunit R [Flavobacterium caeni]|uniref:Type I restriction enzyme, R subunit n=1 Tax=Flavobacterium caeni TaxID=490189 RepID=A0A1G5JHP8_9FLAO|nr:type I restriction endonuclease subunit R [Flavobacterium caeni]SCY87892.1 type I restriction enzyme, R subunit [Flavobacterium caeni]
MNETQTRYELIDPALKAAGWDVVPASRLLMEFPINKGRLIGQNRRANPDKADYILRYKNRNLAVIEAKAATKYYTDGVGQAKAYAEKLQIRFAFATNGKQHYQIDMQEGVEGDVLQFPSPDELWEMTFGREERSEPQKELWTQKFDAVPFETKSGQKPPRYYQVNSVNNVLEALASEQKRILLTLATGTGKTATAFHIAWKLFQTKWNLSAHTEGFYERSPRILFLADRNLLADQALTSFNEYNAFEEDVFKRIKPSEIKKEGKVPTNAGIFFTIFQTFVSEVDGKSNFGQYPKDFFDFIIIDECHRGGAKDESSWRTILDYFSPAVQLGLTATPKRTINADTYDYFGKPVYTYSLKDGINDGFLTPFRVKQIDTTIDDYVFTSDDTVIEGEIEEGRRYTEADMNRIIEIKAREEYRVKIFMEMMNQNEKTLVFCATQDHAAAVRDLINQISDSKNPNYCQRVTANDGTLGEQHLRDFQNNEKRIPTVLTTSQKLSTGVDAPEIKNIVLLRPVNSMIEFKQIVGRGTRLFDGKDYFTIYDFVKAYLHFSDPEWDGEPLDPVEPLPKTPVDGKPCTECGQTPCTCLKDPGEPCPECGYEYCRCEAGKRKMTKVKLADGKVREFQHMFKTTFWSPDGKPISGEEFLQSLFGTLPEFFKNETELRKLWSDPQTRSKLLEELTEKGFPKSQLVEFQSMLGAQESDLYDVLAYIAFHASIEKRQTRAERARIYLKDYNHNQQQFLDFVLKQYVARGSDELDDSKIADLLVLKYHAISDAKKELGEIPTIRKSFIDFQSHLYDAV